MAQVAKEAAPAQDVWAQVKDITITGTTQELAARTARLWDALEMLRTGKPPETDARRASYDAYMSEYGGAKKNDANAAIATLEKAHIGMLTALHEKSSRQSDLGESAAAVHAMLAAIQNGMVEGKYDAYDLAFRRNQLSELDNVAQEGRKVTRPTAAELPVTQEALPAFEINMMDLGPIQLLSKSNQGAVQTVGEPVVTPTIRSMFGLADANAQGFLKAYSLALSYQANHMQDDPNMTKPEAKQICQQLLQYIDQIPSSKEILNENVHPSFNEAVKSLRNGSLANALLYLGQETSFNSVYSALSNFFVINVDQRAVALTHMGTTVKWQFDQNQDAFTRYIKGLAGSEPLEPKITYFALGLYHQYLSMTGVLQQLEASAQGLTPVGKPSRVVGSGNVGEVRGAIGVATSSYVPWKKEGERWVPMVVVLHCSGGYREWGLNTIISADAKIPFRTEQKGGFLGVWGLELQFPGEEGHIGRIRVERIGGAGVGQAEGALAYITFAVDVTKRNNWKMETRVTPQFSDFLGQVRWGAEVKPLDVTRQWSRSMLSFGPGIRYEYNVGDRNHTIEAYGQVTYKTIKGINVTGSAGWVGEFLGNQVQRIPSTAFGSVQATFTVPSLFRKSAPRPVEKVAPIPLPTEDYLEAVDYMNRQENLAGPEAQKIAVDLYNNLLKRYTPSSQEYAKTCRDAARLLSQGKLADGMALLRTIPDFQDMEKNR